MIENLEKLYSNKVQIDGMYDFMEKINKNGQIFHSKYEVIDRPVNKSTVYSKTWRISM